MKDNKSKIQSLQVHMGTIIKKTSVLAMSIHLLEQDLKQYIEFSFGLEHHNGEGYVIINTIDTSLAPFAECLCIIESKGKLTEEDFLKITI